MAAYKACKNNQIPYVTCRRPNTSSKYDMQLQHLVGLCQPGKEKPRFFDKFLGF